MWFTGRGDEGFTDIIGHERVSKDAPRVEALGDLDEASAAIGLGRALTTRPATRALLHHIQRELSTMMAEVAAVSPEVLARRLGPDAVASLEADITAFDASHPGGFILPGENPGEAALNLARTVVRRAERRVVTLLRLGEVTNEYLGVYLNRLSSLLFLLARAESGAETP